MLLGKGILKQSVSCHHVPLSPVLLWEACSCQQKTRQSSGVYLHSFLREEKKCSCAKLIWKWGYSKVSCLRVLHVSKSRESPENKFSDVHIPLGGWKERANFQQNPPGSCWFQGAETLCSLFPGMCGQCCWYLLKAAPRDRVISRLRRLGKAFPLCWSTEACRAAFPGDELCARWRCCNVCCVKEKTFIDGEISWRLSPSPIRFDFFPGILFN